MVLSLYMLIGQQVREVYNFDVSILAISSTNGTMTNAIVIWQNRSFRIRLSDCLMDGLVFKVREGFKVINKTIDIALDLRRDGKKEVLGLWLGKSESTAFWMRVLTDVKARGVEDMLVTATDAYVQ